ncbi:unnamed protein product, partial [Laminaria digitata]
ADAGYHTIKSSRQTFLSKVGILYVAGLLFSSWALQLLLPVRGWLSVHQPNAASIPLARVSHFKDRSSGQLTWISLTQFDSCLEQCLLFYRSTVLVQTLAGIVHLTPSFRVDTTVLAVRIKLVEGRPEGDIGVVYARYM